MPRFFGQSGGIRFKQGVHRELCGVALNKMRKEKTIKQKTASDFETPSDIMILHSIMDCCEFLKQLPDQSVQLICIDPPYNLELIYLAKAKKMPAET